MDKQNEGIQEPSEEEVPDRHERLATVDKFGKQEGLHKKQRRFISYLKNFDYPEKPLKYKHIRRISD